MTEVQQHLLEQQTRLSAFDGVTPPRLLYFSRFSSLLARERREALHSGCGMPLIACQPLPCASPVGALLAEIPVVLPNPRRKRPGYLLSVLRAASYISC